MKSIAIGILAILAVATAAMAQAPTNLTKDEQLLMEAAYTGKLDQVQLLVSQGISIETVNLDKRTPLMSAAFNGHTPVVSYLLDKGAKVDAKDVNGRAALMYAASGPYVETVELLLKKGAEVNLQGELEGFTALMTAAAEGQLEVAQLLLRHGADVTLKDVDGDTAESFARQKGHLAVADLLKSSPATHAGEDNSKQ